MTPNYNSARENEFAGYGPNPQYLSAHRPAEQSCPVQNVGNTEKWLSLALGGGLLAAGLSRGRLGGLLSAVAGGALVYRGVTGHCSVYEALGINTAEPDMPRAGVRAQHGTRVVRSIHIHRSPKEIYDRWRDLSQLPQIMQHLVSVTPISETRSRWVAQAPLGKELTWDAEIINDRPGEIIAWQSLPESEVDTAGSVRFRGVPGGGTEVEVSLKYDPPGGFLTDTLASFFGEDLASHVEEDLRQFQKSMEASATPRIHSHTGGET